MSFSDFDPTKRKYLKAQERLNLICECLYAYNNELKAEPGIYIFTRVTPPTKEGFVQKYIYVGQAVKIIDRVAQHIISFGQRIDISLKNRGLWYPTNPYGWKIHVKYCDKSQLDQMERQTITNSINKGYTLYNITSGGQGEGKEDINERSQPKSYRDGLKQGYANCLKQTKEFFDKYLDVVIKSDSKKKDGTTKEIYKKKEQEFKELIK